jgi:VWFA-related protein
MNSRPVVSRRQLLQSAAVLCLSRAALRAQEPSFSTAVSVVNVFVTVRDKKGSIVTGLTKDDFVLSEEGQDQTIRYFSRQSDLPLTLGLLVDTTPSETNMLATERNASSLFFEKVLRPDRDKAFLIQFAEDVQLLQDLTSSRAQLEKALDLLQGEDQPRLRRASDDNDSRPPGPQRPGRGGGGDSTVLSDAIYLGADEVLKPQSGRKAMIVLGDGDHIGNRQQQAVTAAQRADSLVYAIRIYDKEFGQGGGRGGNWHGISVGIPGIGIGGPGGGGPGGQGPAPRSDGKRHLEEIAAETGGSYFEVTKKQSLEQIYQKIEEELRNQYSLGYTPANTAAGFRHIKVSTKQKALTVQARSGYYPKSTKSST